MFLNPNIHPSLIVFMVSPAVRAKEGGGWSWLGGSLGDGHSCLHRGWWCCGSLCCLLPLFPLPPQGEAPQPPYASAWLASLCRPCAAPWVHCHATPRPSRTPRASRPSGSGSCRSSNAPCLYPELWASQSVWMAGARTSHGHCLTQECPAVMKVMHCAQST